MLDTQIEDHLYDMLDTQIEDHLSNQQNEDHIL